jgi:hypothetical protein
MNKLVYLLILFVFTLDFLNISKLAPKAATYLPDVLAMLVLVVVVLRIALGHKLNVQKKYIYLIAVYTTILFITAVLNASSFTSIVVGVRGYFRYLPVFLLPAIHDFSERQFKKQLLFVVPFLMLQCPVTLFQRLIQFSGLETGDVVRGTVGTSGALSITMICAIAVLLSMYLEKKIKLKVFLILAFCMFIPTTINETKVTLFLLPVALLYPVVSCEGLVQSAKVKNLLSMALVGVFLLSAFIPVYDYFMRHRRPEGILGFLQNERTMTRYLYLGAKAGQTKQLARVDMVANTYKRLAKDPETLAFGLGLGSTKEAYVDSPSSPGGNKPRMWRFQPAGLTLTQVSWDLGLCGLVVYSMFFVFVFRDATRLKKTRDAFGAFALGWSTVVIIMALCTLYLNFLYETVIVYMFWYFSGLVAARACRMSIMQENYARQRLEGIHALHVQTALPRASYPAAQR